MHANTFLPKEESLKLALSSVYESFGYRRYKLSGFEEYSFYSDNRSFLADEGFIAFNNADGKLMALKPDITLSIVKSAANEDVQFTRAYYEESVYRSAGREEGFREMGQIGLELLGNVEQYGVAEVVYLALQSLKAIDSNCILSLSHMSFVHAIEALYFEDAELRASFEAAVKSKSPHAIEQVLKKADIPEKINEKLCTLFSVAGKMEEALVQIEAISELPESVACAVHELRVLQKSLKAMQVDQYVQIDLSLMHTIDYYNGVIFEGYVEKIPFPVLSGGRYDPLAKKFKEGMCGVGFAVYLDNMNLYYPQNRAYDADVLIISEGDDTGALLKTVASFVDEGLTVRVEPIAPKNFHAKKILYYKNGKVREEN